MLCLYYNMFWELRKPHFDGTVQSKIVFPESEVFCRRLAVPVIFIIVIKQKKVIIFTYGDVFANVLLWYKGGGGGNEVTTLKRNLYGGAVPYRWDSDVLGRVTGPDWYINFKVECWEKDHDGLGGDGGHSAGVNGCYSFCNCDCPFVVEFNFLVH